MAVIVTRNFFSQPQTGRVPSHFQKRAHWFTPVTPPSEIRPRDQNRTACCAHGRPPIRDPFCSPLVFQVHVNFGSSQIGLGHPLGIPLARRARDRELSSAGTTRGNFHTHTQGGRGSETTRAHNSPLMPTSCMAASSISSSRLVHHLTSFANRSQIGPLALGRTTSDAGAYAGVGSGSLIS